MTISVEEIMLLMDKLQQTGLQELSFEQEDFSLTIRAKEEKTTVLAQPSAGAVPQPPQIIENCNVPSEEEEEISGNTVVSPIVGTFYAAVSPDKPPYVAIGTSVNKGDTLCIIESMKIMNEIQSEYSGTVKKILVENGDMVEYGQPLMIIE